MTNSRLEGMKCGSKSSLCAEINHRTLKIIPYGSITSTSHTMYYTGNKQFMPTSDTDKAESKIITHFKTSESKEDYYF